MADKYEWLEDIEGERQLEWVRERNAESTNKLACDPDFPKLKDRLKAVYDSSDKIPFVTKQGNWFYNFWKDATHERGVWRRTTLEEYKKEKPVWHTILDLDELCKAEGINWVWGGAEFLPPEHRYCLIDLSRGGADATETREFDVETRSFVKGGYFRPEAKGGLSWIDSNTVYVSTDFGPGSMTTSGYARTVREWRRGTPMSDAKLVYEGLETDMSISAWREHHKGYEKDLVYRILAFYNDELFLRKDSKLIKIDAPNDAEKTIVRDWLFLHLRSEYNAGGRCWTAGSLIVCRLEDFIAGKRDFSPLFEPTDTSSLAYVRMGKSAVFLNIMDNVKNTLWIARFENGGWHKYPVASAPKFGTLEIWEVDSEDSDDYFMSATDFLTPPSLYYGKNERCAEKIKQAPSFFDSTKLTISQHFAVSEDGTKVPYFMVASSSLAYDGNNPTLLYGYGGFEISLTPNYAPSAGLGWLSKGGVYVVANIRGGGEYGPRWHQAALKENRKKAYEDFAAVAKDLFARKVTNPSRLGIQGGSNGGLLMGNMTVLYPDLFTAVVCEVPLLDMRRYHLLLAGASWMAEYGNPDTEDWNFLKAYSPYHNVREDARYPAVLFMTSTRDDRVHPGHARKMMAKMRDMGHDVIYYENIEGGHGGAANNEQIAHMRALAWIFLKQRLMEKADS